MRHPGPTRRRSYESLGVRFLLCVILCSLTLHALARSTTLPLPQAVVNARTPYIDNQTDLPQLEYTAILELQKWGHFELAESKENAGCVYLPAEKAGKALCT
jgi:hypothetical protein